MTIKKIKGHHEDDRPEIFDPRKIEPRRTVRNWKKAWDERGDFCEEIEDFYGK